MKIVKGKVNNEFSRDLYWGKLIFSSEDKVSTVFYCVSSEYYWNQFYTRDYNQEMFNKWLDKVVAKWEKLDEKIFEKNAYFDIYAVSEVGKVNALEFLKNING